MRRLFLAVFVLAGLRAFAQEPQPDTLNAQQRRELMYSALYTTPLTTGVLLDRTVPFSAVARLDGTRDTAIGYATWQQMYLKCWNAS